MPEECRHHKSSQAVCARETALHTSDMDEALLVYPTRRCQSDLVIASVFDSRNAKAPACATARAPSRPSMIWLPGRATRLLQLPCDDAAGAARVHGEIFRKSTRAAHEFRSGP